MSNTNACCEYLERNHIEYAQWLHKPAYSARDVANAAEIPMENLAKTVIYRGDNGFGMLLLPANARIDFAEVLRLMGLRHIRLATEDELVSLFPDSEVGAMPAIGNSARMPVLVDAALAGSECIYFSGGTHTEVIGMIFADFERLVNPLIGRFAVPEP